MQKSCLWFSWVFLTLFMSHVPVLGAIPGDDYRANAAKTNDYTLSLEEKLARDGNTSFKELFEVRGDILTMARTLEPERYYQLKAVFDKAGVKIPAFTGTYLDFTKTDFSQNLKSRGVLGDIDLASLVTKTDFDRVLTAAKGMGYTVEDRVNGKYQKGGSATIAELETTIFTPKDAKRRFQAGYFEDPEMVVGAFFTPEGKMIYKDPSLYLLDNVKKSHGAALKNTAHMSVDDVQMLVKATIRIESENPTKKTRYPDIDTVVQKVQKGQSLSFEDSMVLVKGGHTVKSSGMVNPNLLDDEYQQAVKTVQSRCLEKIRSEYKMSSLYDDIEIEGTTEKYKQALKKGDFITASAYKDKLYQQNRNRYYAIRGATRNGNLATMAHLEGMDITQEMRKGGVRYLDKKTGIPYTASQLENKLLAKNKRGMNQAQKFDQEISRQAAKAQSLQECKTVLGHVDAGIGAFHGFKRAEGEFLSNMTGDESILEFYGTTVAQGTYYALGLDNYTKTSRKAFAESQKQFEADLAAGNDPSVLWATTRGVLRSVNDVGLDIIKNLVIGKTVGAVVKPYQLISEGTGLLSDRQDMHAARQNYDEFKARIGTYRLEIAHRNARVSTEFDTFLDRIGEIQSAKTVSYGKTTVRYDLDDVFTRSDLWYGQFLKKRLDEHRAAYQKILKENNGKMTAEVSQKLGAFNKAIQSLDWYKENSMHKLAVVKARAKLEALAKKMASNRAKDNPAFRQFYDEIDSMDLKKLLAIGLVNDDDFNEKEFYLSQGWVKKEESKGNQRKTYYVDGKGQLQGRHVVRSLTDGIEVYREISFYEDNQRHGELTVDIKDEEHGWFRKTEAHYEKGLPVGLHKGYIAPGIIQWQATYTPTGQRILYQTLSGNYQEDYEYNVTEYDESGTKTRNYTSKSPVN
ncbi:MAG: hypothetical protein K9N55_14365 [Phycisphaerae bacterium]|nr:hypothetical protein [Phycisphaerae bacterium]